MRTSFSFLLLFSIFPIMGHSADARATSDVQVASIASLVESQEDYQLHGIAKPKLEVILTAPLQGVLADVLAKPGDVVRQGDLLASMDDRVAVASVNSAAASADRKAALEHAKLELELAEILWQRLTAVGEISVGSAHEIDEARVRRDQAMSGLNSAKEELLQAQRNWELELARLETHRIRAPFDGQVMRVPAVPGGSYSSTDTLMTIVNLDVLIAELNVPDALFGVLRVDEDYRLLAGSPVRQTIDGKLRFIEPVIDVASQTFRCHFEIDNTGHRLPAGFAVRLDLKQATIASMQVNATTQPLKTDILQPR